MASEYITRALVIALLGTATIGMFVVSIRGNYLYGYSIGQTEEKRALFAWANVAADVWKAFGLIALTALWRSGHRRVAISGSAAWMICVLSGVNSAIGVYVQDRTVLTGAREAQHESYHDAEKELSAIEPKAKGLGKHRSVAEVDAQMVAILARPIMAGYRLRGTVATLSADCRKPDGRTAEPCSEVAILRGERAVAEEASRLEERARQLRGELANLRGRGDALSPDPVGEFYAWATRGFLSVRDVGFGFPLFFALLIEVVSAFGPITVMRFAELSVSSSQSLSHHGVLQRATSRHDMPQPAELLLAPERGDEGVALWMSQRATPRADGAAITLQALHEDYRDWCRGHGFSASTLPVFSAEFDRLREMPELAGKIRKFGTRYFGVGLVHSRVPLLSSRHKE